MIVEAPDLAVLTGIRHAFFTREGGVSTGIYASLNGGTGSNDDKEAVKANRRRMAAYLSVPPENLVSLHQVHSADCLVVTGPWPGERPKADAMVTATPNVALAVASADCGPILFADTIAGVVGAAHSGWKGAFTGVVESTIQAMEGLGSDRANIVAALGPTIGPHAYEVGPEFVTRFLEADESFERFFRPAQREHHSFFDLPAFIAFRFEEAGIGRFGDVGLCTYSHEERFFSYRRSVHRAEPDYGRLISAIVLEG